MTTQNQEADSILIHQLKRFAVPIDDNIKKISEFDAALLYTSAVTCVKAVFEKLGKQVDDEFFPEILPRGMAECFRTCTNLADTIQELGYKNKIGFDQFLYPNERDSRDLLSWLIEQAQPTEDLSKSTSETISTTGSSSSIRDVRDRIQQKLQFLIKSTWVQKTPVHNKLPRVHRIETFPVFIMESTRNQYEELYQKRFLPFISEQCENNSSQKGLAESIFEDNLNRICITQENEDEWNSKGIDSGLSKEEYFIKKKKEILSNIMNSLRLENKSESSLIQDMNEILNLGTNNSGGIKTSFTNRLKFETNEETNIEQQQQVKENPEEEEKRRIEQIEHLQKQLDKVIKHIEMMKENIENITSSAKQIEERLHVEKAKDLSKKHKTLITTLKLGGKSEEEKLANIKKMEKHTGATAQHLINLANEWEKHRKSEIEKYRKLKEIIQNRKTIYREKLNQVKKNRELMKIMIQEIRDKESLVKKLHEEIKLLPKNLDRSSYVIRILDVVRHVEKQKAEMSKVMIDNRSLQKEIENISITKLFRETEDLIFKTLQETKDQHIKNVYKYLVELRDAFDSLISMVKQTGECTNQSRDLETQIQHLSVRHDSMNMTRILKDLEQIRNENKQLINAVKKFK